MPCTKLNLNALIHRHLSAVGASDSSEITELVDKFGIPPAPSQENFSSPPCLACNGFYGPNFRQPYCATCHTFLCPENPLLLYANSLLSDVSIYAKSDNDSGEDSGNDEGEVGTPADASQASWTGQPPPNPHQLAAERDELRLQERIRALSTQKDPWDLNNLPEGRFHQIPSEVVVAVFKYLDDLALWSCSRVCKRWFELVRTETTNLHWAAFVQRRWEAFTPLSPPICWFQTFHALVEAAPCQQCLRQMILKPMSNGDPQAPQSPESTWRSKRLCSEMKYLQTEQTLGITARPLDPGNFAQWLATIEGPQGSPYEGGKFFLLLQIPSNYPMRPPVIRFLTRIFHPNVSKHGDIGMDTFSTNWSLALTIVKLLHCIQSLLADYSNTEVAMDNSVLALIRKDRRLFEAVARAYTWKYAMTEAGLF